MKVFRKDGTTKPFEECVNCVASNLGKDFQVVKESLDRLYEYRNSVAHFYSEELDLILYSLLKANVIFYSNFIKKYFQVDLFKETNLILLPIGFSRPYSPIDLLSSNSTLINKSSEEVVRFIKGIIESSQRLKHAGIEDSILIEFRINLTNETRIKNADVIAGINNAQPSSNVIIVQNSLKDVRLTNDPNAKAIKVSDEDIFQTIFTETYNDVAKEARKRFDDFKQNKKFNKLMAEFKKNENLCRLRFLNPNNKGSSSQEFYNKQIYDELSSYYQLKS